MGCFVAIIGCFIIGWQDFQISGQALYGDILAFIAAGIITAYFLLGNPCARIYRSFPILLSAMAVARSF